MMIKRGIILILIIVLSLPLISCKGTAPEDSEIVSGDVDVENNKIDEAEIKELGVKAEGMIREQNWSEAGSYLSQAKELSQGREILAIKNGDQILNDDWVEDAIIQALIGDFVFTKEDTRLFMEGEGFRKPEEPKQEIFEGEALEALEWFRNYRSWLLDMLVIPGESFFENKSERPAIILFSLDSFQELTQIRKKYMANGYDDYSSVISYWIEIEDKVLYLSGLGGFGLNDTFLELAVSTNEILNFEVKEDAVVFEIFHYGAGYDVWEGVYIVTFEIERKEDGTFRVGSYNYVRAEE